MWGKVTIKDIANKCGVSTATVSRAINNNGYIASDLKQQILDTCNEMGYIPNSTARSLKVNSTGIIGYITSDISNQYHITVAKAVGRYCSKQTITILLFAAPEIILNLRKNTSKV